MVPVPPANGPKLKVLILGAGFGGLECAKALRHPDLEVILLDRQNHHLFQPLLYQVATASLTAPDIAAPIREILTGKSQAQVRMEEVTRIDLSSKRVLTDRGSHAFDFLVIALGARTSFFGHPDWARHALGLKSLEDARKLRHRVLHAIERAELCEDLAQRQTLLSIVIVGGGPTGVELAGAFTELIHRALKDGFRNVAPSDLRVTLVEAGPRLLGMFDSDQSAYARERLRRLGITVLISRAVEAVEENHVRLSDGTALHAATIVWAAGTEANPVTAGLDVEQDSAGRLIVAKDCSLREHPNVFAIGDIARCRDRHGVLVPPLAAAAIQMGRHVAKIIREDLPLRGSPLQRHAPLLRRPFAYVDKGIMAIIGKSAAVVKIKQWSMKGFIAWLAWLFVHLLLLVGFRNKLSVLLQWAFAYLKEKRSARIIVAP